MPSNAHGRLPKPPVVEAQGHNKNPALHTIDKSLKRPVNSKFGKAKP